MIVNKGFKLGKPSTTKAKTENRNNSEKAKSRPTKKGGKTAARLDLSINSKPKGNNEGLNTDETLFRKLLLYGEIDGEKFDKETRQAYLKGII